MTEKTIIFSDLDGTLLDPETYSFEAALPALGLVKALGVPLVLVSSKTGAEMEAWRKRLGNIHPFITENGGGIFVPEGYFPFPVEGALRGGHRLLALGTAYETVRQRFRELWEETGAGVRGFGDMTVDEVRELTGLTCEDAELAMRRDFDEPFVFTGRTDDGFLRAIESAGLRWTRGRLFHIMGSHDKGLAVNILQKLYTRQFGAVRTVGIGNDLNDLPLLLAVDRPVLVRKTPNTWETQVDIPGLFITEAAGPEGWNETVMKLFGDQAGPGG